MKRQSLIIIIILSVGSLFGVAYSASTSISDSGIITTNLTILGTCTGCGGGEGSFSNYNTIALNTTIATTPNTIFKTIRISDAGNVVYSGNNENVVETLSGVTRFINGSYTTASTTEVAQSSTGIYQITFDDTTNFNVSVFKNGVFLKNLGMNTAQFTTPGSNGKVAVAISPNGKYIAVVGEDSGAGSDRLLIFQGS